MCYNYRVGMDCNSGRVLGGLNKVMEYLTQPAATAHKISLIKKESAIEKRLVKLCNAFNLVCVKLGNTVGIDDRLVAGDNGRVMWLEIKKEQAGRISRAQQFYYNELKNKGHIVKFINNDKELDNAIREFLAS